MTATQFGTTICHYMILVTSIMGNSMLIMSLTIRQSGLKLIDKLMLNGVACNLLLVLISVPIELILQQAHDYPFNSSMCKFVNPTSTYLLNSCVFTYVVVAVERWIAVSSLHKKPTTKLRTMVVFFVIHMCGLSSIVPYIPVLEVYISDGRKVCGERWEIGSRRSYTLFLFLIQYGIPVPLLLIFYAKTWFIVFRSNKRLIESMLKTAASMSINVFGQGSLLDVSCRKQEDDRRFRSRTQRSINRPLLPTRRVPKRKRGVCRKISGYFSVTGGLSLRNCQQIIAFKRREKQTRRLLLKFTIITSVFVICMLPNQILWLVIDFREKSDGFFSELTQSAIHLITYANCVINPFLYGNYDKRFRRDLRSTLLEFQRSFLRMYREKIKKTSTHFSETFV